MLALVLLDDRRDFLFHEVADGLAEELVLRVEVEIHGASLGRNPVVPNPASGG
jgi:hypothetical protein